MTIVSTDTPQAAQAPRRNTGLMGIVCLIAIGFALSRYLMVLGYAMGLLIFAASVLGAFVAGFWFRRKRVLARYEGAARNVAQRIRPLLFAVMVLSLFLGGWIGRVHIRHVATSPEVIAQIAALHQSWDGEDKQALETGVLEAAPQLCLPNLSGILIVERGVFVGYYEGFGATRVFSYKESAGGTDWMVEEFVSVK